jgi:dTDP-4-dehydrorhamnose reductase
MKRILLIGSGGYIGQAFVKEIQDRGIALEVDHNRLYYHTRKIGPVLNTTSPDLVINCAAFITKPSVDLCENHKADTLIGNLVFPHLLACLCSDRDIPLLHVSTGCLYSGDNQGNGFTEMDPPMLTLDSGCGIYVASKELAERAVRDACFNRYICRIRLPFSNVHHERNYISKLLTYPKIYSNVNSISCREDFVKACLDLWHRGAAYGTYNMTNPGSITAREIIDMVEHYAGIQRDWKYWEEEEFMASVTTKKSNCVLNVDKLLLTGVKIRPIRDAVQDCIINWI